MRSTPICHRTIGLPMGARECMGSVCSLWVETASVRVHVGPTPNMDKIEADLRGHVEIITVPALGMCAEGKSTWMDPQHIVGAVWKDPKSPQ